MNDVYFPVAFVGKHLQRNIMSRHIPTHLGENLSVCGIGPKTIYEECNLTVDMVDIHGDRKPFSCNNCGKGFTQKQHMIQHMKIHSGEKPFSCSVCLKRFSQKHSLTGHMRIHTGERPFSCSICEKSFSRKNNMTNHMKTHTGEIQFFPCVCGKTFTMKEIMMAHMRIHTGGKPFSICEKISAQLACSDEKPLFCSICFEVFNKKYELEVHMFRAHGHTFSCSICEEQSLRGFFMIDDDTDVTFCHKCWVAPVSCELCEQQIPFMKLRIHLAEHAGEQGNLKFRSPIVLQAHFQIRLCCFTPLDKGT